MHFHKIEETKSQNDEIKIEHLYDILFCPFVLTFRDLPCLQSTEAWTSHFNSIGYMEMIIKINHSAIRIL